nr:retrovirus-related Pol polyprotein from transposon TNT 1-94 [Tanacetum cinerariifolium]
MEAQTKAKLNKKAHSAVILCLDLTLEEVMATLNSKEIKERSKAKGDDGKGLYVRGRTDRKDSRTGSARMDHEFRMFILHDTPVRLMLVLKKRQSGAGLAQKTRTYQRGGSTGAGKVGAVWQEKSRKAHYSGSDRLCSFKLMGSVSGGIIRRFKHEAFGKFKEWNQLVENQTGRTVKKLRTDNEEEDTHEPLAYQEAVACEDSSKWKAAMKEDLGISRSSSWVKAGELQMAVQDK